MLRILNSMKLAVSSIAWTNEEETEVAELLQSLGVKYVEVAPTKLWANPTDKKEATDEAIQAYKTFWESFGIEVVAFQSMLFTCPDLKLFESAENRQETLTYLQDFIGLAGKMNAGVMVFGSPKNRQRGEIAESEALKTATDFFSKLGDTAQQNHVSFCIEPNAEQYACDFITNAQQGIDLVTAVNNPGFRLHLDIACMTLASDDVAASITAAAAIIEHFHISSPMLEPVEDREDVHHREAAAALRSIGYDKYVSIEMRPGSVGENVARVRTAVEFAQGVYGA
jgi:D-psicose/D-tagatose/L-ribulose 3-epimerase